MVQNVKSEFDHFKLRETQVWSFRFKRHFIIQFQQRKKENTYPE